MGGRLAGGAVAMALLFACGLQTSDARASVVEHGYLPLSDGTQLSYTLTRPSSSGRFPAVLEYGAIGNPTLAA